MLLGPLWPIAGPPPPPDPWGHSHVFISLHQDGRYLPHGPLLTFS